MKCFLNEISTPIQSHLSQLKKKNGRNSFNGFTLRIMRIPDISNRLFFRPECDVGVRTRNRSVEFLIFEKNGAQVGEIAHR